MDIKKIALVSLCLYCELGIAGESNFGQMYWNSIKCGGVTADLMINHRTVAQPTLFLNQTPIKLQDGPNYSGPLCVTFRGEKKIGYVESMGNAYESYYIIDIDTFKRTQINYQTARKIGFGL